MTFLIVGAVVIVFGFLITRGQTWIIFVFWSILQGDQAPEERQAKARSWIGWGFVGLGAYLILQGVLKMNGILGMMPLTGIVIFVFFIIIVVGPIMILREP